MLVAMECTFCKGTASPKRRVQRFGGAAVCEYCVVLLAQDFGLLVAAPPELKTNSASRVLLADSEDPADRQAGERRE